MQICCLISRFIITVVCLLFQTQKQEVTIDSLQTEVDQTNEELDKLNTAYLEERAQLIHDLQSCEREIDSLKDVLLEKDKEISALSGNISEYTEQLNVLKQELKLKEENLIQVENALGKAERELLILRESQNSDQQSLENQLTELVENLKDTETELIKVRDHRDSQTAEVETLLKQADDDKKTILELRGEIQKQMLSHCQHLSECEAHVTSLKEQLMSSAQKLQESSELQQQLSNKEESLEKELKSSKDEQNRLHSQVEKYRHKMQTVTQQLEEQKRTEDIVRGGMKAAEKTVASLEIQLKEAEKERQRFQAELKTRDSEQEKMSSDLQSKSENISNLQNLLNSLKSEKKQLQEKLEAMTEELDLQKEKVHQLSQEAASALDAQVQQLSAEAARLHQELSHSHRTVSELRCETESMRDKVSVLETQVSENGAVIKALQEEKEELTLQNQELSRVLEQSSHASSETLLEKTNQCGHLQRLLREEEEKVAQLQEHVQSLASMAEQLRRGVAERDGTLADLQRKMDTQQEQLTQLQEQEHSLKTQLAEKEDLCRENQSLKSKVSHQKNAVCKLQSDAKSLEEKHSQVCQQMQDREEMLRNVKQQCQQHKEELNARNETIKSLTEQMGLLRGNARELESDAELKQKEVLHLHHQIQAITEDKQQLHAACQAKEEQLVHQSQLLSDLQGQLKEALEQNASFSATLSSLTENNQGLREDLAQEVKSVSQLAADKSSLQEQLSGLEKQISEDRRAIDRLLKEKEELVITRDELKKLLEESQQSNSAGLLQKTNECAKLSAALKEKEGQLQSLSEDVGGLKQQVAELTELFNEKERIVLEQSSQLQEKQKELWQLGDSIRVLQGQESVLRSGIVEKDALIQQTAEQCHVHQKQVTLQESVISQLEVELACVRGEHTEAKLHIQQKEEELNKQRQSVLSLGSQLSQVKQKNGLLTQELEQRNTQVTDLSHKIQALNEQSAAFKRELERSGMDLARSQEEVAHLKAKRSGQEGLQVTLQQKETLIQQMADSKAELDQLLRQKTDEAGSLSARTSDLQESVCRLRAQVESSAFEVSTLQRSLEQKEQSSLEWQSQSAAAVETLRTDLQAKEAECSSLKEQLSHLQESVTKLNNALQAQTSEVEDLKQVVGQKDLALSDQGKCLQEVQRRADEALLFKTQFMESTELVSQLQSQLHSLSTECGHLKTSAEETQSAFNNLKEKYATSLEELQDARRQLSQRMDEVSSLQQLLGDTASQHQRADSTIETLRSDIDAVCHKLERAEDLNSSLSKEKDEALASHQAKVSLLTVEIEKLRSQHVQVAAQMNVLTENLEQREMALHAINSQYSSQAKHTSQLLAEMQKLEEANQRLKEEIASAKEEHQKLLTASSSENARLKEEVGKSLAERKELENRCHQMEQESSSLTEMMERATSERDGLQTKVSVNDKELAQLKENVGKIEQILQVSEREWLLVLEREKQEKNLLVEQLRSVEDEMNSKDVKVNALKQDLDCLQEKLALASTAVRQGSDQLSAKELEASVSRVQLEKVLASVQEKEFENSGLQQAQRAAQQQLHDLLQNKGFSVQRSPDLTEEATSLRTLITQLEEHHQGQVHSLRSQLTKTVADLERTQEMLDEGERRSDQKDDQAARLQAEVEQLQRQLGAQVDKSREAAATLACLNSELQEKGDHISCMTIQLSQQQQLVAGLSQQLMDKDAAVAQVMESAANERIKASQEQNSVLAQLDCLKQDHQTSVERFEERCEQLEGQVSRLQAELQAAHSQKVDLIQEKEAVTSQLVKVTKDKDAVKKKLQAALLVRKELLKKVEQYEKQAEENAEVSRLQEATNQAQAAAERYKQNISDLKRENLEMEGQIMEHIEKSKQLQSEKQSVESTLNEKEQCLSQALQTLMEKSSLLEQLQASAAEEDAAFEQERKGWMQKLDELQQEMQNESSPASAAAAQLEKELARVTREKTKLEKKVQAALLARKETMKKAEEHERTLTQELTELRGDHQALLEQQSQLTNDLRAVQGNLEEKLRELEELHRTCSSDQDELASLRQLLQERDKSLQDLQMSLDQREHRSPVADLKKELENLKSQNGNMYEELARKDEALMVGEERAQVLQSKLLTVEEHLEKAQAELREKSEQVEKHQDAFRAFTLTAEQEKGALESQLNLLTSALEQHTQTAAALQEMRQRCAEQQSRLDLLEREQVQAATLTGELKDQLSTANTKLAEFDKVKMCEVCKSGRDNQEGACFSCQQREKLLVELKEREEAFLMSKAQLSEKEELIAALELQLRQQTRAHDMSMERVKAEAAELQRSQQRSTQINDQDDSQSKIAALTRKLQAALLSRKELIKENSALKQDARRLADKEHAKELENSALEAALEEMKREHADLEESVRKDKDELRREIDQLLSENHSLSAACDSLKLTVENISQQKEAFSCQLESLKDSQREELSKWKSKHAELQQEYESLLQSYENISSEVDKMRQVLEAAKRDKLEAVRKSHRLETERDALEKQARELEGEHERIKEKMRKFSKEKLCKVDQLEEENQTTRRRLSELEENHSREVSELAHTNQQLEAEICKLRAASEELKEKHSELHSENKQMAEKLEESKCALEKRSVASERSTSSLQLKLDDALGLIETRTAELGAQMEMNNLLQKEKQNLSQHIEKMQSDQELQLGKKDVLIQELQEVFSRHSQETISLNEKVRILEDDKSLLQEELENALEILDKAKNENEYLETLILQNSEKIDELTASVAVLQSQNLELNSQLAASKDMNIQVRQEKEEEQLRLVREFEEKLKTVQRGSQGSKNVNKELQELLKEKHQEINQLQQNCIRYQEVILELESSSKSSRAAVEQLQKELKKSSEELSAVQQKCSRAEAELSEQRNLLQQAEEKLLSVESERDQMALEFSQASRKSDNQQESQPAQKTDSSFPKEAVLRQQMEELALSKDQESEKVLELKQQLDSRDVEVKALEGALKSSEAKLCALSASPGGAEASSLWNQLYQKALSEKDDQLLEQGFVIKRFLQDMRVKEKEMDELRVTHLKLERTINEYSVAAAAQQRQLFVLSANNAEVCERAEVMAAQVKELSAQVDRLEEDNGVLHRQLSDREDLVGQTQLKLQQTEKVSAQSEAQLLLLQSQNDKLQAASENLEGITAHLKTLLQSKDAEISSLLSCKDGQMSGYVQQLQANGRSQAAAYEARLAALGHQREAAVSELRGLQAKLKHLQIQVDRSSQERQQTAAQMDSFKKSMAALQSEREQLMSQYRTLETESRLGLRATDGGGGASKGLKHEIRKLLNQMDDLNSENAMLRAQLVRYREDLNQVLSLKDNQLKVLLQKQQDVIRNLEQQKAAAEKRHREAQLEIQHQDEESNALRAQLSTLKQAEMSQRSSADEGKVLAGLQQKLLSQRTLQEHIHLLEEEKNRMSAEAKDKDQRQISAFERQAEAMRSDWETAERRAAKLAEDQLELQQKLSESESQSRNMRLQNESLCKAMAALQNDRDQLIEDFKTLRKGYDQELRESRAAFSRVERSLQEASSDLAMLTKQRDVLLLQTSALESKETHAELSKLVDQLSKALSEKERELSRAVLEKGSHSRQLAAFSSSMGSLQNERDRLLEELSKANRLVETRQGSGLQTSAGVEKGEGTVVSGVQSQEEGPVSGEPALVLHLCSGSAQACGGRFLHV